MRIDRGLLGWGVFFIVLGAVPLAVRAGLISEDTVRQAWELWPLILIGIGLGLVLQRTKAAAVGGLIVAITFGLMGGSLIVTGITGGFSGCGVGAGSGTGTPFATRTGTLDADASVSLELNCGEVAVNTAAGSGWSIAGSDNQGTGPQIEASSARLQVRSAEQRGIGFLRGGQRWQVTLPTDPTLRLDLSVNAGSGRVSLPGARVSAVSTSVNAGDARLDLSGVLGLATLGASANAGSLRVLLPPSSMTGNLSANAGSVEVCVPSGVGIRIHEAESTLSSNNFGSRGLVKNGSDWTSSDYATATVQIDLTTSANAGSIALNPENGCE